MRTVEELAPTVCALTPLETTHRVLAQCDRLAFHAGFTVPDPGVEEPTQVKQRLSLVVVQDRNAQGSGPTDPYEAVFGPQLERAKAEYKRLTAPTVSQACLEVFRAVWRAL